MPDKTADPRSAPSDPHVLSLRQVTFGYQPNAPVLHDISAHVQPGRICALIGPNAAGKSTLVKLMLGQLQPWSGQVRLSLDADEIDIADLSARQRARRISYVPQRGGVSFAFTVREVVAMGRFAAGTQLDLIDQAMDACDLTSLADRTFNSLSAGQQQRVLVARAMAQAGSVDEFHGRIMLLDEPGSNMDLHHAHQLMGRLRRLADGGLAVVIVLHDLNLTARYADDVWLLDQGRLVAAGPWPQVLQSPVLEPVYRMSLQAMTVGQSKRPVFVAEPSDTLSTAP